MSRGDIERALRDVTLWPSGAARIVARLGSGPTRESWLIDCDGARYVVRLCTPDAALAGLSCSGEAAVTRAAAAAGLGPRCVAAYGDAGIVITRYIEGRTWSGEDLDDPAQRRRLAALLARLHQVDVDVRAIELPAALRRYAEQIDDAQARTWASDAAAALFRVRPRPDALCHGDVVAANVIDDGNTLWLVDWEFAGRGNPYFDLAGAIRYHDFSDAAARTLLTDYDPGADERDWEDLARWCAIYDRLLALWWRWLETAGRLGPAERARLEALRRRL